MPSPAEQLEGRSLDHGWNVLSKVNRSPLATGGNFSTCYIVEDQDGRRAFLKALDYSRAMSSPDPARVLQALTESFNFERDVLFKCRDSRLDRIVIALDEGSIQIGVPSQGGVVQYLIFELADGDVRSQANMSKQFDLAFALRSLHHISVGLWQLHGQGIAHQDLKPSNILLFDGNESKLADLGRSSWQGHSPPHEVYPFAGDPSYAPPELLYRQIDPDWNKRRKGCDAYLMGSMVVYFFAGAGATALLASELDPAYWWMIWTGAYKDVLPYVQHAFSLVVTKLNSSFHPSIADDLRATVQELCNPDPELRGHPKTRLTSSNQYSMERYVSRFNLLARKAELGLLRR